MLKNQHDIIVTPAETDVRIQIEGTSKIISIPAGDQVVVQQTWDVENLNAQKAAENAAKQPSSVPSTQGESELGQLNRVWNGKVDANGNLLAKDGSVLTKPDTNEPLKGRYKNGQELLDDIAAKNYKHKVKVDGGLVPWTQYFVDPPAFFGSEAGTGDLIALEVPFTPAPVIKVPAPVGTDVSYATVAPPAGFQAIVLFPGPAVVTFPNQPGPVKAGNFARIRVFPQAGGERDPGDITVDDGEGHSVTGNAAGQVLIAVGDTIEGATLVVRVGATLTVSCLNPSKPIGVEITTANHP